MYPWVVFVHVLAAFAFFLAHGTSAMMAFRLKRERNTERIRAILDLSNFAIPVMYTALIVLVLAGIIAGFIGNWFSRGWIWAAIVLLVVMVVFMNQYRERYYMPIRRAAGLPYRVGNSQRPAQSPASEDEIARLIEATRPGAMAGISSAIIAIIVWLMMFKPF